MSANHALPAELRPWLDRLRELPPIQGVRLVDRGRAAEVDPHVRLRLPGGEQDYLVDVKRTAALAPHTLATLADRMATAPKARWLLVAPYISAPMGLRLRELGADYVDAAGNCHLAPRPGIFVHVEGRRPIAAADAGQGRARLRGGGLHVLFVLAARPELANAPVRELARLAGAGKTTTAQVLARLTTEGLLGVARGERRVLRHGPLVDRWLAAYAQVLRRKWLVGRFRPQHADAGVLEPALEKALAGTTWALGGTAAEMRLVRYYRGPDTVVHLAARIPDLPKRLHALPDPNGPLVLLVTPMPVAFAGTAPHVAHPLLVYAELMASSDERAHRAAEEVRQALLVGSP